MRKQSIIWLITAFSLVLIGSIVFAGGMMAMGWDFKELSTSEFETNYYDIEDSFLDLSILADTADITFLPAEDLKCSVVCYEETKLKHSVSVKDGVLFIELEDTRKWYDYIGIFHFGTPKITVYLPRGGYGALSVKASTGDVGIPSDFLFNSIDISQSTGDVVNHASAYEGIKIRKSTGDICVENVSADALDLTVSTGHVTVSNVSCKGDVKISVSTGKSHITDLTCGDFESGGNTGDIFFKNVIMSGNLTIERSTGDVEFDRCDAGEIFIKTDTGDVTGSLMSEKTFITETDTGRVVVPETITGGRCKVFTDTGDIKIAIVSNNP